MATLHCVSFDRISGAKNSIMIENKTKNGFPQIASVAKCIPNFLFFSRISRITNYLFLLKQPFPCITAKIIEGTFVTRIETSLKSKFKSLCDKWLLAQYFQSLTFCDSTISKTSLFFFFFFSWNPVFYVLSSKPLHILQLDRRECNEKKMPSNANTNVVWPYQSC